MDRADAQFFSNRDRIVTQQSNSCTTTCGLTSRNSRFGDCGHGAGELTSNDPTLCAGSPHDEDQRIRTPAIRRKRAEGFPAVNWVMLCPALATVINYSF